MRKRLFSNGLRAWGPASAWGVALALTCLGLPGGARGGPDFERTFTYQAEELDVGNLLGEVEVRGSSGSEFRVTVHVQGEDASPDLVHFEEHPGRRAQLLVKFPTDEHHKYVYPRLGPGSRSTFSIDRHGRRDRDGEDWLGKLLTLGLGDHIEVRGRSFGGAIELWADVLVEVPKDHRALVHLGAGKVQAHDVQAAIELHSKSGPVHVEKVEGDVAVDTGNGGVDVRGVAGDLDVDTGSGGVEVYEVHDAKRVKVDTGSGSVEAGGVRAEKLDIDTGSGHVRVDEVDVRDLAVDTGSGGVTGDRVSTDGAVVDTGSGGVELELLRMGHGRYTIKTGSGSIRLRLPREISADFDVDTGSGGIEADIDGVSLDRRHRHEAHFTVGGGESRVRLSTGSGSVRLVQAHAGRTAER